MWKDIRRALGYVSFLSMYLTGIAAVVLVASFGSLIAQGLQAVLMLNIEPKRVSLPFPWLPVVFATALPWPIAFSGRPSWATLATIPMVGLPLAHLVRLYMASA